MKGSSSHSQSLSIVIPTKDRIDHLRHCVESILAQTVLPDEVIIVDGSTERDLQREVEGLFRNVPGKLLKYFKSRPSLTAQNNLGIDNSTSDLITILDDDVVLDRDYILRVKEFFGKSRDPHTGALSTKIMDPGGSVDADRFLVGDFLGKIFMLWHTGDGRFQRSGIPTLLSPGISEVTKVDFIFGGNATYPRQVLQEFRFDEDLPMGFMMSDDDLAYRISRTYQNYWTPDAVVFHRSHIVGNDRYSKVKQFVVTHSYLRNKHRREGMANRLAFGWSMLGKIILELYYALKNRNLSGLKGIVHGFKHIRGLKNV